MSRRTVYRDLVIVMGLALALPLWAKTIKPMKKSVELASPARVGDTALPAGEYKLIVDDKTATFEKDDKVVAEAPYQWIRIAKAPADATLFDKDELTEIDFAGKSLAIEFADKNVPVSPTPSPLGNQ